jgi:hypothetical protein
MRLMRMTIRLSSRNSTPSNPKYESVPRQIAHGQENLPGFDSCISFFHVATAVNLNYLLPYQTSAQYVSAGTRLQHPQYYQTLGLATKQLTMLRTNREEITHWEGITSNNMEPQVSLSACGGVSSTAPATIVSGFKPQNAPIHLYCLSHFH